MGDRSSMSISADSPSNETLNRCPLSLLLQRQYEFPFKINIVQFSIFLFISWAVNFTFGDAVREIAPISLYFRAAFFD